MRFKPLILFLLLSFVFINNSIAAKQCVILLHALARTTHSMSPIATCLEKANYIVVSQNYLTTKKSIKDLANEDVPSMVSQCQQYKPSKIHFVTHSLGGIVLREYLQGVHLPNLGRVVMLAPPNHGSQLADLLHRNLLFKLITGPAGQELTTSQSSTPNTLNQSVTYQLGIIAGNFSFNPFSKAIFHEDNDGKVSVSSARIKGMKDFIIVPVSHMFMTNSKLVQQEIVFFLQNGEFRRTT